MAEKIECKSLDWIVIEGDKMRKIYVLDLIMTIVNVICFFAYIYFKNDMTRMGLIVFSIFIVIKLFISLRLKTVIKYSPSFKLSWRIYLYIFLLLLANIQFLLVLLNNSKGLYWSVIHFGALSLFILDYSYISKNKLICRLDKIIDLEDIEYIEVRDKAFGDVYMNVYLSYGRKIRLKLTDEEYKFL